MIDFSSLLASTFCDFTRSRLTATSEIFILHLGKLVGMIDHFPRSWSSRGISFLRTKARLSGCLLQVFREDAADI